MIARISLSLSWFQQESFRLPKLVQNAEMLLLLASRLASNMSLRVTDLGKIDATRQTRAIMDNIARSLRLRATCPVASATNALVMMIVL